VVRGATDWARTTPATRGPHASSALTQRNAVSGPRQRARERSIICVVHQRTTTSEVAVELVSISGDRTDGQRPLNPAQIPQSKRINLRVIWAVWTSWLSRGFHRFHSRKKKKKRSRHHHPCNTTDAAGLSSVRLAPPNNLLYCAVYETNRTLRDQLITCYLLTWLN
jgi:hypothetical protein